MFLRWCWPVCDQLEDFPEGCERENGSFGKCAVTAGKLQSTLPHWIRPKGIWLPKHQNCLWDRSWISWLTIELWQQSRGRAQEGKRCYAAHPPLEQEPWFSCMWLGAQPQFSRHIEEAVCAHKKGWGAGRSLVAYPWVCAENHSHPVSPSSPWFGCGGDVVARHCVHHRWHS